MAVISVLDLHVKPELVESTLQELHRRLADTRAFAGCLGVDVTQDISDPSHLHLVERWASIEADTAYRNWRAADGAAKPDLADFLIAPPNTTVGEILDDV